MNRRAIKIDATFDKLHYSKFVDHSCKNFHLCDESYSLHIAMTAFCVEDWDKHMPLAGLYTSLLLYKKEHEE